MDSKGDGNFSQILKNIGYNLTDPHIVNDQLFFISDHEGIANIYRSNLIGEDICRVSNQIEFYARNLNSDPIGSRLVYHAGGDIFEIDLKSGKETKRIIEVRSPANASSGKVCQCKGQSWILTYTQMEIDSVVISRGRFFELSAWKKLPKLTA